MMICGILHIFLDISFDLFLGAGPFFVFKCMGSASQSGKLLFKSTTGCNNIYATDQGNNQFIQDKMISDGTITQDIVVVGSGTSICSSQFFRANSLTSGGAWAKRGIQVPIIGSYIKRTATNTNCGLYQNGLIINGYNNTIWKNYYSTYASIRNNIIHSKYSCIGLFGNYGPLVSSEIVKYSSIINSENSNIRGFSCNSTLLGGKYNSIIRSEQSTIISGYCNKINDNNRYQLEPSKMNFIGGGYCNRIENTKIIPPYNPYNGYYETVVGGSIISGSCNVIDSGFYSSILSGNKNNITIETSLSIKANSCNNLIAGGQSNKLSSYSQYEKKNFESSDSQSIINGKDNIISTSPYSTVLNGCKNYIKGLLDPQFTDKTGTLGALKSSAILNGKGNYILVSNNSLIVNGSYNTIGYKKIGSANTKKSENVILNGITNEIVTSKSAVILSGENNIISSSEFSSILTGSQNSIGGSFQSTIISGSNSSISSSCNSTLSSQFSNMSSAVSSTIIGCCENNMIGVDSNYFRNNVIIAHSFNCIDNIDKISGYGTMRYSFIIGGCCNRINGNGRSSKNTTSKNRGVGIGILGGYGNKLNRSSLSTIIGGYKNSIGLTSSFYEQKSVYNSAIIGGTVNRIKHSQVSSKTGIFQSCQNVIVGGKYNQFTDGRTVCNNVIVGGTNLYGYITDSNGNRTGDYDLAQADLLSLRGKMYVTDNSGKRCQGLVSLYLDQYRFISSICVVKGIIITMSYT